MNREELIKAYCESQGIPLNNGMIPKKYRREIEAHLVLVHRSQRRSKWHIPKIVSFKDILIKMGKKND